MKNNNFPLISILIANYNNGHYIKQAINSVIKQDYDNWEIIIVDDCSFDDSIEILDSYKGDVRIKVFQNEKNYGCGYTKARCVLESNGDYCGFLDPDDVLVENAISTIFQVISKNDDLSLVTSNHIICDEYLKEIRISRKNSKLNQNETYFTSQSFLVSHFTIFSKKKYLITEGINISLKRAVDQDLYYKLDEVGSISFINKPLYKYRQHSSSLSTTKYSSLKAKYWHALVIEVTYFRRKKNKFPNISKNELNKVFEDLYIWKAIEKIENKSLCISVYFIFKSFIVRPLHNIKYKLSLLKRSIFIKSNK